VLEIAEGLFVFILVGLGVPDFYAVLASLQRIAEMLQSNSVS
jgi:hypothetical protein